MGLFDGLADRALVGAVGRRHDRGTVLSPATVGALDECTAAEREIIEDLVTGRLSPGGAGDSHTRLAHDVLTDVRRRVDLVARAFLAAGVVVVGLVVIMADASSSTRVLSFLLASAAVAVGALGAPYAIRRRERALERAEGRT